MNNKKKMVLGAAFIVAIMALAGIGYAVAAQDTYKGETSSAPQTVNVDLVKVKLGDPGYLPATDLRMTYNSVTTASVSGTTVTLTTTYTLTGSDSLTYTIEGDGTAGDDANAVDSTDVDVTLTVAAASAFSVDGYKLQVKYTSGGSWQDWDGADELELSDVKATIMSAQEFSIQVVENNRTGVPPATISIPALTFTIEVTNA